MRPCVGRRVRAFRDDLPVPGLVAAVSALGHAAAEQAASGAAGHEAATSHLTASVAAVVAVVAPRG